MCVYIYICVCVCVCVYIYIYMYVVCVVKLVRIMNQEYVFASTVKPGFCISEAATYNECKLKENI